MYNRKGKEFAPNTVKAILTNEKYKGWNVRNKYDTGTVFNKNSYGKVRDEEEWIIHKHTEKIPAIVSEEDFDKVQEFLYGKTQHQIRYFGISEFASKIICSKCGAVYYSNKDKERIFYNCSTKRKFGTKRCNNKNISLKRINEFINIEEYLKDTINAIVFYAQQLLVLEYKLAQSVNSDVQKEVEDLNVELEKLNSRKSRILNMYENGYINNDELEQKMNPLEEQIKDLKEQIKQLSKSNDELLEDLSDLYKSSGELRKQYEELTNKPKQFKKEHTREKIIEDIKRIIVKEDGTVDIYYHSFEKYYKITEKYKDLLDVYVKEGEIEKFIKQQKDKLNNYYKNLRRSHLVMVSFAMIILLKK